MRVLWIVLAFAGSSDRALPVAPPAGAAPPRAPRSPPRLATVDSTCGMQTCGPGQACMQGCCGAFECTPPPPYCVGPNRSSDCTGCGCFAYGSLCPCAQGPDGRIDITCTLCP